MEARVGIEPPQGPYLLDLQHLTIARIDRNCTDLLDSVQFRTNSFRFVDVVLVTS